VSEQGATAKAGAKAAAAVRPRLLFFYSGNSGQSRRVDGFLAQVLQRRRNHDTFRVHRLDCAQHHDLVRRCGVSGPPSLVVVEGRRVRLRIEQPSGCREIETAIAPWLR